MLVRRIRRRGRADVELPFRCDGPGSAPRDGHLSDRLPIPSGPPGPLLGPPALGGGALGDSQPLLDRRDSPQRRRLLVHVRLVRSLRWSGRRGWRSRRRRRAWSCSSSTRAAGAQPRHLPRLQRDAAGRVVARHAVFPILPRSNEQDRNSPENPASRRHRRRRPVRLLRRRAHPQGRRLRTPRSTSSTACPPPSASSAAASRRTTRRSSR